MYRNTPAKTSICYMQVCMRTEQATDSAKDNPVETMQDANEEEAPNSTFHYVCVVCVCVVPENFLCLRTCGKHGIFEQTRNRRCV